MHGVRVLCFGISLGYVFLLLLQAGLRTRQLALVSTAEAVCSHISWLQHADASAALNYMVIATGAEATTGVSMIHGEVYNIHSESACGASVINQAFLQFLCSLDIPGNPEFFKDAVKDKNTLKKLLQNFEASKAKFDGVREMSVELPISIFLLYQDQQCELLRDAITQETHPRAYIQSNFLRISPDICLEWYEPTISSTVELVRKLDAEHHVEALFVVGGFAKCKVFHRRLEKEFHGLVVPEYPGLVVVNGALRQCM